jgi:small-conductance mechanosensitive channel
MVRALAWLAAFLVCLSASLPAVAQPPAAAASPTDEAATLRLLNRDVVTFRAPLAGATPRQRVDRAMAHILEIPPSDYDQPLRALPLTLGSERGAEFLLGDRTVFSVLEADIDPDARQQGLDPLVRQTLANLEDVRAAWHATRDSAMLTRSLLRAAIVTACAIALAWIVAAGGRRLVIALEVRRRALAAGRRAVRIEELVLRLLVSVAVFLQWLLFAVLAYAWIRLVLGAFLATQPIARRMGGWLAAQVIWVLNGIADAVPGLVSVAIIVALTRAISDLLGYVFRAIQAGRLRVAFLHPETVGATMRIVIALVWALGIAVAYPYLPGASSDAFKGISVLVGLMVTLGSTSIVSQAMSGLVVIFSRALRRGDHVIVGDVEGVVVEVGTLATKVMNFHNEEITIPNSVLVGASIHNFSKLAPTQGTMLSTTATVGYDTPWPLVHRMLEEAAAATPGLRADPAPRVYTRTLASSYVEYELVVGTDRPLDRVEILSALRANILDAAERAQVQLLTPQVLSMAPRTHPFPDRS